jgi:hypothetical protein
MNIRPFVVDQLFPENRYWDVMKIDGYLANSRKLNRRGTIADVQRKDGNIENWNPV